MPALVEHLLESIGEANGRPVKELTADGIALLQSLPWPGNVRELRNLLEQACAMTERMRLTRADLLALLPAEPDATPAGAGAGAGAGVAAGAPGAGGSPGVAPAATPGPAGTSGPSPGAEPSADRPPTTLPERIARLERDAIVEALGATGGNRRDAARRLGIARATLYERLKTLRLS
jgi:DNA-binding NtrC family response regulator